FVPQSWESVSSRPRNRAQLPRPPGNRKSSMRFALTICFVLGLVSAASAQAVEDMAGQMVMVGFTGTAIGDDGVRALRDQVSRGEVGGVMFLRTNVESLASVRRINRALIAARPWLPPFIGLDQE